ncbi:hypothetical protein QBC37DRAFT_411793 [Rhypophila decipiens]|uniref:Uncharacterized protein n=1 Tax=Rhypophila decipiens TaxID=261697 RepID=A0AAN6YLJ3_9PEZI|nr:hypothetical protein QBC37DRAFT_411793 [Rhypophila decipiens]
MIDPLPEQPTPFPQLDAEFALGSLVREEPHSNVRRVMRYSSDSTPIEHPHVEARVFMLEPETVPEKVRRHRLRNVKRLAGRKVQEYRLSGPRLVVIYTIDKGNAEGSNKAEEAELHELPQTETEASPSTSDGRTSREQVETTSRSTSRSMGNKGGLPGKETDFSLDDPRCLFKINTKH